MLLNMCVNQMHSHISIKKINFGTTVTIFYFNLNMNCITSHRQVLNKLETGEIKAMYVLITKCNSISF